MNEKNFYEEYAKWRYLGINESEEIPKKMGLVKKIVSEIGEGNLVLDVGCGDGFVISLVKKRVAAKFIGGDISHNASKLCMKREITSLVFDTKDNLPFKNRSFDVIICLDVLEHLFSPEMVIKEFNRLLKRGGKLIILVPNANNIFARIKFLMGRFDRNVFAKGHLHYFTPKKIKDLLEKYNFNVYGLTSFVGDTLKSKFIMLAPLTLGIGLLALCKKVGEV